ncbi:double-strand break repair protein AddB [Oceanibaculum pacificum]|uniref:Double-strand break repair protein AddB n=1 Tax=Oceanibaculum pacificum TaxID=580166 RepID=A0A154WFR9_9PROT|nr:double-strand break repair protein AddB [Oceanibaculum pacificum]KZD12305.1 double-strand break repair protein AddB [Oceanibaculum pacificum]
MADAAAPPVFTIPPTAGFVDALAAGLMQRAGGDPLALSRMLILLPTRRGGRSLRDAFLRLADGRPMLLPRMMPLGDLDAEEIDLQGGEELLSGEGLDIAPAIPGLQRQLLLARLILQLGEGRPEGPHRPDQAVRLAAELARLLDQVQTEQLTFDALAALVPEDYARHWQVTLEFLRIVTEFWPRVLADYGALDPAARRNAVLEAQADIWHASPPDHPIVVAGSTGSVPATRALMAAIAALPQGLIVLPGLDKESDDATWTAIERDETHPQFNLAQLIRHLGVTRGAVRDWTASSIPPAPSPRQRLVAEALRPAETTEAWRQAAPFGDSDLAGLSRIDCATAQEEAGVIALVLRQALEVPGKTAALVTPDRSLARRVAAELARWELLVDDSAGVPLMETPPGGFLRLTAALAAERCAPLALLAALKHPLAAGGEDPADFRRRVRLLEEHALRGPRPKEGVAGIREALEQNIRDLEERTQRDHRPRLAHLFPWLDRLEALLAPFSALMAADRADPAELLEAHGRLAEALAASRDEPGPVRLWRGEAGEAAANFLAELREAAGTLGLAGPGFYPALLDALLAGRVVRPRQSSHPRLSIWGPLEARLQQADLVVLGGLNEGTWPPEAGADPWMSRPMRRAFGLPLPERRIGLSAHDFAQGFAAPEIVLTRAEKVDGAPTVPSRWLLRLDTVLGPAAATLRRAEPVWRGWWAAIDRPPAIRPVTRPEPRPPLAARPTRLSVTEIETLMRDPYAIYAAKVLRLHALDPIDADPGAAERGTIIHKALERFLADHPGHLPPDAQERLLAIGAAVFAEALERPGVWAFWWPRFERIASWFVAAERERHDGIARTLTELRGQIDLAGFTLTAKADRIDLLKDGTLALIDYKTGQPPAKREVAAGHAPQLPLEALIAAQGGFPGLAPAAVSDLSYWRLSGGDPAGKISPAADDIAAVTESARDGLERLIAAYADPATPYLSRPDPDAAPRYSDYLHLARVKEWSSSGEEEAE